MTDDEDADGRDRDDPRDGRSLDDGPQHDRAADQQVAGQDRHHDAEDPDGARERDESLSPGGHLGRLPGAPA